MPLKRTALIFFFLSLLALIDMAQQKALALDLKDSDRHRYEPVFGQSIDTCLMDIMAHPLGQQLSSKDFSEYFQFCQCVTEDQSGIEKTDPATSKNLSNKSPKTEINDDSVIDANFFSKREQRFLRVDLCGGQWPSEHNWKRYYAIFVTARLSPYLRDQLIEDIPSGVKQVAKNWSIEARMNCLHQKIMNSCIKNYSISFSYRCIQHHLKAQRQTIQRDRGQDLCPQFSTDDESPMITEIESLHL